MPRIADIIDDYFLRRLERRVDAGNEIDGRERELERLLILIREKEALIARLKATDEKRSDVFRRNMRKWRAKQREVKKVTKDNRNLRRLLRSRRAALRERSQRQRDLERAVAIYASGKAVAMAGEKVPLPFDGGPVGNLGELIARKLASIRTWPWRHWMRLGKYHQYDPRPLTLDRLPAVRTAPEELPKITLVTPSFRQAEFLESTIKSVLDQEYPFLDYIVMDGGSDDGSLDIIKRYAEALFHWRSETDGGQAAAIREGLALGSGEIMAWLNSDDVIFPGTLAYVADYFLRHPEVDVVYGHRIILDDNGCETGRWILPPHDAEILSWADFIPQECTFWRKSIYEKVGGMDPTFQFAMDWDLFLRFQRAGAKFVRLPYFMGGFRVHAAQKNSVTKGTHGYREMKRIRDEALGHLYQKGSLHKRIDWLQMKAVWCALLWRIGIRW